MSTRQDQLHSYQFVLQRVVSALVMRDTDPPQSPFRRVAGATLAGVMVATLALAATAVYGALSGRGSTNWRDSGAIVVEKESGARFVYRDGKLHPVANYASALLILESGSARTVLVSRESIAGVPRGTPLGIPGAPDTLPPIKQLARAPWTVCSQPAGMGATAGPSGVESLLFVGADVGGGRPLGEDGLLARQPDATVYLLWHQHRHLVRDPSVALPALSWSGTPLLPVAPALLNALPAGGDLARPEIKDRGRPSSAVPDARIGQVFVVESQGGGRQYAVALRAGLAPVTQVEADLIIGDPLTAQLVGQGGPKTLEQGEYALIPKVEPLTPPGEFAPPAATPSLVRPDLGGVCVVVRDAGAAAELRVGATVPEPATATPTGSRTAVGTVLADRVVVPPGGGAVVEAVPAPEAKAGTLSVVTDLGVRYEVAGPNVLSMLGFGGVHPLRLPTGLVALLPAGRPLDPAAARSPYTG